MIIADYSKTPARKIHSRNVLKTQMQMLPGTLQAVCLMFVQIKMGTWKAWHVEVWKPLPFAVKILGIFLTGGSMLNVVGIIIRWHLLTYTTYMYLSVLLVLVQVGNVQIMQCIMQRHQHAKHPALIQMQLNNVDFLIRRTVFVKRALLWKTMNASHQTTVDVSTIQTFPARCV